MIPYSRDSQQVIPTSSVKIIGLGGAGANMLERIALDGMEGAELMALNTDIRTLGSCIAREKIQLGVNLTKGLGAGGDPELGHQAVLEAEEQVRAAIKDRRIVFLCVGLGGGTGSGAAPIVTRIAREEGAFVVVFATMPFAFEGKRRRDQAETSLNELAVLSNALVTFDNNRMGELVLAKQGIHEAFVAADLMICESIKAVIRLVVRPGLINVGLDDLMSALRTNRSRCLFGSGLANGKDRAIKALRNALSSPLLDQGALLREAQTVLVHLSGGEDLTLFEIELLMQRLQKFVPDNAHVLFGAAVDPALGDSLSLTLISALPEDSLAMAPRQSLSQTSKENPLLDPSQGFTAVAEKKAPVSTPTAVEPAAAETQEPTPEPKQESAFEFDNLIPEKPAAASPTLVSKFRRSLASSAAGEAAPTLFDEERPFAEPDHTATNKDPELTATDDAKEEPVAAEFSSFEPAETAAADEPHYVDAEPDPQPIEEEESFKTPSPATGFTPITRKRPLVATPWSAVKDSGKSESAPAEDEPSPAPTPTPAAAPTPATPAAEPEVPKLKLGVKSSAPQSELGLDSAPRGRFEGENPNVFEGEDLDLPPFLRKKK